MAKSSIIKVPNISEWKKYSIYGKYSYDLTIKIDGIGYKFFITPRFNESGKFLGDYALQVFVGEGNRPSEVKKSGYGYAQLGNFKTPAIAVKQVKTMVERHNKAK
jgi:hypothetical protein